MKKEDFKQLKKELLAILVIFTAAFLAFRIIFIAEDFFVVLRSVMAIFWLFVIPGYAAMFYWNKALKFYERIIIGIGVGSVLLGLMSYYTGLLGLHAKYHALALPSFIIIISILINMKK